MPPTIVLPTATSTATPLPTATPRPSWMPDTCGADGICLSVGFAEGQAGERVTIAVALATGGASVAGTQNDLVLPPELSVISCTAHPSSGKEIYAAMDAPSTRVLVLALDNTDPITDGAILYTCDVDIAADALAGRHLIRCVNAGASDPSGKALLIACEDGVVTVDGASEPEPSATEADSTPTVSAPGNATPTATSQSESGGVLDGPGSTSASEAGGCAVGGRAGHDSAWGALLVPVLLLLRRRAVRWAPGHFGLKRL
jgi:hypothetical protein